jgi:hypothetical protein
MDDGIDSDESVAHGCCISHVAMNTLVAGELGPALASVYLINQRVQDSDARSGAAEFANHSAPYETGTACHQYTLAAHG